jgi:hypothetical protein
VHAIGLDGAPTGRVTVAAMRRPSFPSVVAILFVPLAPACGGPVASGVAVGRMSQGLAEHAHAVPLGAERCAVEAGLAAPAQPGTPEKALSETCSKEAKSDELWRRSMVVLAAYGSTVETIASGAGTKSTGKIEAARTGVDGPRWIEVEDASEKAAAEAAAKLVEQTSTAGESDDLEKTITAAAPHVKRLCDGLGAYLASQADALGKARGELETKRGTRDDRRCGTIDNKGFCVSESTTDRVIYAHTFGQLALAETQHRAARDAVAAFCAAHRELESAASAGKLSDDETHATIVRAVKSSSGRGAREE